MTAVALKMTRAGVPVDSVPELKWLSEPRQHWEMFEMVVAVVGLQALAAVPMVAWCFCCCCCCCAWLHFDCLDLALIHSFQSSARNYCCFCSGQKLVGVIIALTEQQLCILRQEDVPLLKSKRPRLSHVDGLRAYSMYHLTRCCHRRCRGSSCRGRRYRGR